MIDINHLNYSFGKKEILSDISFHVARGSFYAIMGANGSGKTTLLRCMANLLTPPEGSVTIDGSDVRHYAVRMLAQKIALVQQHPSRDLDFTAFDIVMMGRNPYQHHLQNESQEDRDIVERCMVETNTWHLREALPAEMSGGELQRVMIARALSQQTPLLLLDEPTSNLDIAHQFEIMELLCRINEQQGKTILIVVHDLNLALRYCPSALLLHDHHLFFQGTTSEALSVERIRTVFCVESTRLDDQIVFKREPIPSGRGGSVARQ